MVRMLPELGADGSHMDTTVRDPPSKSQPHTRRSSVSRENTSPGERMMNSSRSNSRMVSERLSRARHAVRRRDGHSSSGPTCRLGRLSPTLRDERRSSARTRLTISIIPKGFAR